MPEHDAATGRLAALAAAVGAGAYRFELRGEGPWDDDELRALLDEAVASGVLVTTRTHGGHVTRYLPPPEEDPDGAAAGGR